MKHFLCYIKNHGEGSDFEASVDAKDRDEAVRLILMQLMARSEEYIPYELINENLVEECKHGHIYCEECGTDPAHYV